MDFYERLEDYKKSNKLGNREIGDYIGITADAMRMAIKRKSLNHLQIKEIEKMFGPKKTDQVIGIDPMDMIRSQQETIEAKNAQIKLLQEKLKECEGKIFKDVRVPGDA